MREDSDTCRHDLERFRFLLQFNADSRARAALGEMIAETEARLRKLEEQRRDAAMLRVAPREIRIP
jgi:hypothetical protein